MTPSRGSRASAADDKTRAVLDRFEEGDGEFTVLHLPIGNHRAGHLVDRDLFRKLDSHLAGRPLHHLEIRLGGYMEVESSARLVSCVSDPRRRSGSSTW